MVARTEQIHLRLASPILDGLSKMAAVKGQSVPELLRSLIADALANWAFVVTRVEGRKADVTDKPKFIGRPMDDATTKRGKTAYAMICDTYRTLQQSIRNDAAFHTMFGAQIEQVQAAFEEHDWEFLVEFDKAAPWVKMKGRRYE